MDAVLPVAAEDVKCDLLFSPFICVNFFHSSVDLFLPGPNGLLSGFGMVFCFSVFSVLLGAPVIGRAFFLFCVRVWLLVSLGAFVLDNLDVYFLF